jgi:RNAse (barnase) inhibitor barstar
MLLKKAKTNQKNLVFYDLCSTSSNDAAIESFLIKEYSNKFSLNKIFSRKTEIFDNYGLTAGLLAAIENNQDKYIEIIFKHISQNKLKNQDYISSMQLVFNCAAKYKKNHLLEELDNQFNLIEISLGDTIDYNFSYKLSETMHARVNEEGHINLMSYYPFDDAIKDKLESYNQNILAYNLINFNKNATDLIFEKNIVPNETIIENAFLTILIRKMTDDADVPINYIILNDNCRKIIKESEIINLFFNEKTTRFEIKKEALALLETMDLQEELKYTNQVKKKMKI